MSAQPSTRQHTSLADLDAVLAAAPFGDHRYITEQMHVAFTRRLQKLSGPIAGAGDLLAALNRTDAQGRYRVLGDTVVRCAIQHAMRQVSTGEAYGLPTPMCEAIFAATTRQLSNGEFGPLGSKLTDRIGPSSLHGWIWSAERPDDLFAQAFQEVVTGNYAATPGTITREETTTLAKAVELLGALLPAISESALSHAHLVAIFPSTGTWAARSSSSEFRLSGTVFLSQKLLASVWWTAEHLLHEALHQQYYDLRQGHSVLVPDFDRADHPMICSLWNVPDLTRNNQWDVHRSLAAFHVYVHLALLSTLADERERELEPVYGQQTKQSQIVPSGTALSRAHYLGEEIRRAFWSELGPAGKRFVDWLATILDCVDPSPPPVGAYLHLLFDRYWREAREVAFLDAELQADPAFALALADLAAAEQAIARQALHALGAEDALAAFESDLANVAEIKPGAEADEELCGMTFARLRYAVMEAVMSASPDGYILGEDMTADALVRNTIERSSDTLAALIGR